ncbi:MAG TPA: hypothetical protein PLG21_16930 [Anaerolineae bacterium]|nr:hypothetical protein [Anaerolineae bacterium]
MIDVAVAVLAFLQGQPGVVALAGPRIWAEADYPPAKFKITDGSALCFRVRGGMPGYPGYLLFPSVQFKCYGRDEAEANALYRALYDALHLARGGKVRWVRCEMLGQTLREPELGWPFVLTAFQMSIASE